MMTKRIWKRILTLITVITLVVNCGVIVSAKEGDLDTLVGKETQKSAVSDLGVEDDSLNFNCKSLILMEANSGAVLYKQNPDEALPPASVTKIMTLLLVMEALEAGTVRLDSTVTVSANAASMGGSQVFLKEGEQMLLEDLLKSVVIASANDAAVALAEYIAGSVDAFVSKMNARAAALGMANTRFENVTGLDDTAEAHLTSARDIALMSQALIRHRKILEYSSIWMDSIRDGAFGLTNTNRLVRFYPGCTGLKTGSTSKAGFCVSVTAERDGLSLICVVMGAESRDTRNAIATQALDWGFANYALYRAPAAALEPITVTGGIKGSCGVTYGDFCCVLPKNEIGSVTVKYMPNEGISAPITVGDEVGRVEFLSGERVIGSLPVTATESLPKIDFFTILARMLAGFLLI